MDKVVEHFKENCNPSVEIIDWQIIEHKKFTPSSPRKEIELTIKDKKSGRTQKFKYNYNKILKQLT